MKFPGNRFVGFTSPNQKLADIDDKKRTGSLTLLNQDEIRQLRDKVDQILIDHAGKKTWKPFAIKLKEKSARHEILEINEEDGRELLELLEALDENMVPL